MDRAEDLKQLNDALTQLAYTLNQNDRVPHYYLPEMKLYPTEIHLVEVIGSHDRMNITALAALYGCTKGAMSRQVSKLERKGLLRKEQIPGNKKEVWVSFTELGERAFRAHIRFHERQKSRYLEEYLSYTPQQKAFLLRFINLFTESLWEYDYKGNLSPEGDLQRTKQSKETKKSTGGQSIEADQNGS